MTNVYPIRVILPCVYMGYIEAESAEEAFTKAALAMGKGELDDIVDWHDTDCDVDYETESLAIYDPVAKSHLIY